VVLGDEFLHLTLATGYLARSMLSRMEPFIMESTREAVRTGLLSAIWLRDRCIEGNVPFLIRSGLAKIISPSITPTSTVSSAASAMCVSATIFPYQIEC
jgi:hypothetical protein